MNNYLRKIRYILKEEGFSVLTVRIARYLVYLFNRKITNSSVDIEKWKKIKGSYSGQRAFLIGNGPSLNKTPLYLLQNEFTICFNRFDLFFERLSWIPTAYTTIDDVVLKDIYKEANLTSSLTKFSFFPDIHPSAPIGTNFKDLIEDRESLFWLHLSDLGFTDELPKCGINKTVTNVAIQILTFMGFSEIYLLGVDLDYVIPDTLIKTNSRDVAGGEDDDPNHFDPRYFGKGKKFHMPRMDETFEKFKEADIFLNSKGVKAFNAGVGGKLEVFERVDLTTLFNFSKKEELSLMIGHIFNVEYDDLFLQFPNARFIEASSQFNDDDQEIIASESVGFPLIPKKILSYLPFGPFYGNYLFLKRDHPALGNK